MSASSMIHASPPPGVEVRIVRSLQELMAAVTLRAVAYVHEQSCPYAEEFDGNELAATHVVAWAGLEPVGGARLRWFAEFCKLERLCTRPDWRGRGVARAVVGTAMEHARRKGYERAIAQAQLGAQGFWSRQGFEVRATRPPIEISGYRCVEMEWRGARPAHAVTIDAPPQVINRPEGEWDRPGVLERGLAAAVEAA